MLPSNKDVGAPPASLGSSPILGIDPGLAVTGYGVILPEREGFRLLDYGAIATNRRSPRPERLQRVYDFLVQVFATWRPAAAAIEDFVVGRVQAAVAVGEARAMALLAAERAGTPVYLYKPAEVKSLAVGYGRSSKEQVQEMVRLQLGLAEPPQPADAADALAVALCHCLQQRRRQLMEMARTS